MDITLVLIESPYTGDIKANIEYAKRCMRDCFRRNEYPFASHLLYPGILDDSISDERKLGIAAGLAWGLNANLTAVYTDRGISTGMQQGIDNAITANRLIVWRSLGE